MIPKTSFPTSVNPHGDSPALQACRLAALNDSIAYSQGTQVFLFPKDCPEDTKLLCNAPESIQSISTDLLSGSLAAVDSLGALVIVSSLNSKVTTHSFPCSEKGWCGVSFQKSNMLASSRMWDRQTLLFDLDTMTPILTFKHELPPTALTAVSDNLFLICEWNTVTIWDPRLPIPLVERLFGNQLGGGGGGGLWSASGLHVGGEDRVVSTLDERKWRACNLWKTPLKHDIVALTQARDNLFAFGLDHEVSSSVSSHKGPRLSANHRMFRTRARWSGACVDDENNMLWSRDAKGTIHCFPII